MDGQTAEEARHPGYRVLSRLRFVTEIVGATLFFATFTGFVVQIFFRYALGNPVTWTEEVTMILFLWTVFWSAAFMVRIKEHVCFDVVYDVVSDNTRRIMSVFAMILLVVAFVMLMPRTVDYLEFLMRKKSPVLRIRMPYIYAGYLLFLFNLTVQAVWRLKGLIGSSWRTHL